MFDKINGPSNPMAGPAQGHSTEQGDSWHTAVAKINAAFSNIVKAIEGGPSIEGVEMVDAEARKEIDVLRGTISMLQVQLDAMRSLAAPQLAPVADVKPPDTPPPAAAPIADFTAAPVATGGPGVVTTATTYIGAGGPAI